VEEPLDRVISTELQRNNQQLPGGNNADRNQDVVQLIADSFRPLQKIEDNRLKLIGYTSYHHYM